MTWPTALLGDHIEILSGFAFKSERFNDEGRGLPLVRIRDVVRGRSETYFDGEFSEQFLVKDGDLLVGMDGEFNTARWAGGVALLNQRVCRIQPKGDSLDADYLFRFLPAALKAIEDRTAFATVKHLSGKDIRQISIPIPPLEEQRRVAALLERVDLLRRARERSLVLMETLVDSVFTSSFGDETAGLETATLGELFEITRGGSPRPIANFLTDDPNGLNWVSISDATENGKFIRRIKRRIRSEGAPKSRRVEPGDFLLTNSMSFGRPYIMATTGYIHDGWLSLRPRTERIHQEYLYRALSSPQIYREFARLASGATVKNLNIDLVRSVRIPVPTRGAQDRFAEIAQRIDAQSDRMKAHLVKLNDLFAAAERRAFPGEH